MNPNIYSYCYLFNTKYSKVAASKMVINEEKMSLPWLKIKNVAQNDVRPNFFPGGIKTGVRRADKVHTFRKMGLLCRNWFVF